MRHDRHRQRRRRGAASLGLALGVVLLMVSSTLAVPPGWSEARRIIGERFGPQHAMVVDSDGWLHVVAEGPLTGGLWYASNAGGEGWFRFKITDKPDFDPSIAVDPDGRVTIAFDRRDPDTLHATGIWTVSNVTGTFVATKRFTGEAYRPSVQVRDGAISLAFRRGNDLLYRSNASGSWGTSLVAGSGCCNGGASLRLMPGGGPRIAWSRRVAGVAGSLQYAARHAGTWTVTTVDGGVTGDPELALAAGVPNIAYVRLGEGTYYATPAESGWANTWAGTDYFDPPDVAVDGTGRVFIVEGNGSRLRLATIDNDETTFTVLTKTGNDFDPEVELSPLGKPRVIFNRASGTTNDGIFFMRET